MTLDEFLVQDLCDVPVSVRLQDGSKVVFHCDGSNSTSLTGRAFGLCDTFVPFADIQDMEVLTEQEYEKQANGQELWWQRP